MFSQGWDGFVCPIFSRLRGIMKDEAGRFKSWKEMLSPGIDMSVVHREQSIVYVYI